MTQTRWWWPGLSRWGSWNVKFKMGLIRTRIMTRIRMRILRPCLYGWGEVQIREFLAVCWDYGDQAGVQFESFIRSSLGRGFLLWRLISHLLDLFSFFAISALCWLIEWGKKIIWCPWSKPVGSKVNQLYYLKTQRKGIDIALTTWKNRHIHCRVESLIKPCFFFRRRVIRKFTF